MRLSLKTVAGVVLLACLPKTAEAAPCPSSREPAVRARYLMGTILELRLWTSEADVNRLSEKVFSEVARIEDVASTWKAGSELSRLNQATAPAPLSEILASLLDEALKFHRATSGSFHPALGSLIEAYDLHGTGRWPSSAEKSVALQASRLESIRFDLPNRRLVRTAPGLRFDLDGIAKGWALDRAGRLLRQAGVEAALLNFGGQVLAIGPPAQCAAFSIEIAAPDESARRLYELPLRDGSISTSSNSERARDVAGKKEGHILDPRTGDFARFEGSVSVRTRTAAAADALSTALFVCGPDAVEGCLTPELWKSEEFAAVFLIPDGAGSFLVRPVGGPPPGSSN